MTLTIVWRNLMAHKLRSALTFGAVVLAVFLLCFLRAAVRTIQGGVESAASNRLMVQSAVSLFQNLPLNYQAKIKSVNGVDWICKWQWFGAIYREPANFFAQFGIDPETFLESYPKIDIIDGSYEEFTKSRVGCIVGSGLASKYGFAVGKDVPLIGRVFRRVDGQEWRFTVKAIYDSKTPVVDNNTLFFHFEFLKEALDTGIASGPPGAGVYMVKIHDDADPTQVMAAIDMLFENGPQRVQATTEAEFNRQFVTMLGNVPTLLGSIGGAVLFAIFFAALNTMLMAGRERIRSNGILKAMGFSDGFIFRALLYESLLLCAVGGLVGVVLVKAFEKPFAQSLGTTIGGFRVESTTMLLGLVLALGIGLAAGLVPALLARRLRPVEALRADV